MAKIAALVGLLLVTVGTSAKAEPNYWAWRLAHERLLAKWRCSEPRCGWTVGGYTCASPRHSRQSHARTR
jgi:hypothetical protein